LRLVLERVKLDKQQAIFASATALLSDDVVAQAKYCQLAYEGLLAFVAAAGADKNEERLVQKQKELEGLLTTDVTRRISGNLQAIFKASVALFEQYKRGLKEQKELTTKVKVKAWAEFFQEEKSEQSGGARVMESSSLMTLLVQALNLLELLLGRSGTASSDLLFKEQHTNICLLVEFVNFPNQEVSIGSIQVLVRFIRQRPSWLQTLVSELSDSSCAFANKIVGNLFWYQISSAVLAEAEGAGRSNYQFLIEGIGLLLPIRPRGAEIVLGAFELLKVFTAKALVRCFYLFKGLGEAADREGHEHPRFPGQLLQVAEAAD